MMNASMYMTPYQWMTSGPSLRATGFRLGYVSTRAVTRASMAVPDERTTQNLHAQHAGAFIGGRLTDGHQHLGRNLNMNTNLTKDIVRTVAISMGGLAFAVGAWTAVAAPSVPTDTTTISAQVKADLAFSRDEERMARDLYAVIAAQYDSAIPFSTITTSEQRHYDSIGVLLTRYGIADPAAGKAAGVYANTDIQKLYDSLLAQSKTSLPEAYKVGCLL